METKVILLFVFMGIILLGIISAVVISLIFAIRKRTIVHIIHPNNYITKHIFNGAMPKSFDIKGKTYIYDNNSEFRKGFRHYLYYFYNKSYPVEFDKSSMTIVAGEYNSTEVKAILKTDLVNKLLTATKELDLLRILLFVAIGVGVVGILLSVFGVGSDNSIVSPENAQFIKEQVRLALSS